MRALLLVKQAEYYDSYNDTNTQNSNILTNPYVIGGGAGIVAGGGMAYGLTKKKINTLKSQNQELSNKITEQSKMIEGYKETVNNYRAHLESMGAPKDVINGKASKPGFIKRTIGKGIGAFKSLINFKK